MKQILITVLGCVAFTFAFALHSDNIAISPTTSALSITLLTTNASETAVLKKRKSLLKQKFLIHWLKKRTGDEQKKKSIKILGVLSLGLSLLGVLFFLIGILTTLSDLAIVGLGICFVAFVLGLVALLKRSKLKDKSGTKRWPALLGIILGLGFILGILIAALIYLNT